MTEAITADDLVYHIDKDKNIYSGGYNIKSILMKEGLSPFSLYGGTGSTNMVGNTKELSELFEDLVLPNWATYIPSTTMQGGSASTMNMNAMYDIFDDTTTKLSTTTLYDKLLDLALPHAQSAPKMANKAQSRRNKSRKQQTRKRRQYG